MAETLVAAGGALDFGRMSGYESRFAEGDKGRMEICLRTGLPGAVVDGIEASIRQAGVTLTGPLQMASGNVLRVPFQKRLGAIAIIAAAVAAAIVIVALVLSWKLLRLDPVTAVVTGTVWLALVVGGIALAAVLYLRRGGSYG